MEIGTIIQVKTNIHNYPKRDGYKWVSAYYQLCDGKFEVVVDSNDGTMTFEGKHFKCLGSTFFYHYKNNICGLDLLESDYQVVKDIPYDKLKEY